MLKSLACLGLILICCLVYCTYPSSKSEKELKSFREGSFGFDLQFLEKFDSVIVLKENGEEAQVIISPKYQGKVFTSTAEGLAGKSYGWINYKAFSAGTDPHMNAYGGENRFWLGPEGGPYSLFFQKGTSMNFENWHTPTPIDSEAWSVLSAGTDSVLLHKNCSLINYTGTRLAISIDRKITLIKKQDIASLIRKELSDSIQAVGYRTQNTITNIGDGEWNENTGMPCIWVLDMFAPSEKTTVVIPFYDDSTGSKKIISTNYFGEIPADRIVVRRGVLFYKADGKSRGKLGIGMEHAMPIAGSYDSRSNVLTLTFFDVDGNGRYLNQQWSNKGPVFEGDAVNAYNDGPLENGEMLGPFYEIESVSPAAFLKPNHSLSHTHTVLHLTGSKQVLEQYCHKFLGVSLKEIVEAFTTNEH